MSTTFLRREENSMRPFGPCAPPAHCSPQGGINPPFASRTLAPPLFFRGVGRVGAKPKDMYLHENRRKIDYKVAKKKKATSCQSCHRFRPLRDFSQKSLGRNDEEIGATRSPFVLIFMQTHAIPTFFTNREVLDSFIKEACGGGLVFLRGAAWSSCYLLLPIFFSPLAVFTPRFVVLMLDCCAWQ